MNFYFPTTQFLGKLEFANDGKLERKFDKDQLFFNILNNPNYMNNRLLSNFNNKLHRFFDSYPSLKQKISDYRICFYEYKTLFYKNINSHSDISSGLPSWTLSYYVAAIHSSLQAKSQVKPGWEHVVLTGDIGNFTDWNDISDVNEILRKIEITSKEFLYHPQLKDIKKSLFIYPESSGLSPEKISQYFHDEDFEITQEQPDKMILFFKRRNFSLTLFAAKNTEEILNEIYLHQWKKTSQRKVKSFILSAVILAACVILGIILKNPFHTESGDSIPEKKQSYPTQLKLYPFFNIKTLASMTDNLTPFGFLNIGVMIQNQDNQYLNETTHISKIEVLNPDNQLKWTIRPHTRFNIESDVYWSGYFKIKESDSFLFWLAMDLNYHSKKLPPYGKYTFVVSDTSGNTYTTSIIFLERNKKDPIAGFPEKISYHQKTRKITWKHAKGQYAYSVNLFKGIKTGSENWSQLIYRSMYFFEPIRENEYTLPEYIKLEKGKPYYITIDAFDSPDGNIKPFYYNFIHTQDRAEHIGIFTAE